VIECLGADVNESGEVIRVNAKLIPDTKSGTPGANSVKVKGVITWVSAMDALPALVRIYDRLFTQAHPDAGGQDFLSCLNPNSLSEVRAMVEPSLIKALPGESYQFERLGYFVADRVDSQPQALVFNKTTGLKDSWTTS
jgi:glutaminyl-tRNA synthetase